MAMISQRLCIITTRMTFLSWFCGKFGNFWINFNIKSPNCTNDMLIQSYEVNLGLESMYEAVLLDTVL